MSTQALDALRAIGPRHVLALVGAEPHKRRNRYTPCPACGSEHGTVVALDRCWYCHQCRASRDAAQTAAHLALGRDPHGAEDWRDVCAWAVDHGWVSDDGPTVPKQRTVTVRGRLPAYPSRDLVGLVGGAPALPGETRNDGGTVAALAWRAVAAGVPAAYALEAARNYHRAREVQRARDRVSMRQIEAGGFDARVLVAWASGAKDPRRRAWVGAWRDSSTDGESITVGVSAVR